MDNITQFWGLQCLAGPISRKFVWHELFCALCDVLVLLKLVWDGTLNVWSSKFSGTY